MAPAAHARAAVLPVLALLAGAGAVARADDPAAVPDGGEAVVVGRRDRTVAAEDTTAAATVVDAARFAGESKSVAELVATAPGVAVNQYGGLGHLATVSIRGSTADQVQILLDGLPLNTGAGGGVDLSRIPRAWIERIEVVRGAEAAIYGSGALGGVVNIVTRPALAGAWSIEAAAGSYETFGLAADAAAGGDRWGLLGALSLDSTGGRFPYLFDPQPALPGSPLELRQRDHDAALAAGGLAKLWLTAGPGRLDAVLHAAGGHRDLPGSPYRLTPEDVQRDARLALLTRYSLPLSEALSLALGVSARGDELAVRLAPFPEATQRDLLLAASAELTWIAGPATTTLRVAAATERLRVQGALDRSRPAFASTLAHEVRLAGDRLRIGPALRWDAEGPFHGWSGKLGAAYRVTGPVWLRANGARAFRVPSFAELYLSQGFLSPNPDLVPESSWSADVGVFADGRLGLASVTAFTHLYEDLIVYEPDSFRRFKPFNDGKARARGIEVELATAPLGPAGIAVSGAYTFLRTETLRGEEAVLGKDLPHRARHRLFARLAAGRGPLAAHVEAHAVSERYQDLRNSPALRIQPALTFNAGAALRVTRRPDARVALELRNVLDDRTIQDGFGNPLPGRTVMVTLRVAGGKDTP
jgi:iron complex outermembrane receptor protein